MGKLKLLSRARANISADRSLLGDSESPGLRSVPVSTHLRQHTPVQRRLLRRQGGGPGGLALTWPRSAQGQRAVPRPEGQHEACVVSGWMKRALACAWGAEE